MGIVPIYVWEHFQSADNREGLVARSEQPVLPEVMEERRTGFRKLKDQDPYLMERFSRLFRMFKSVYCPSTPRHVESAALVCELFNLSEPIADARLNAVDYGHFKGQPVLTMKPPHDYVETPYPGGESWLHCLGRWRSFFEEVVQRYDGQPVLLARQREQPSECARICAKV